MTARSEITEEHRHRTRMVDPFYREYEPAWNHFHETTSSLSTVERTEAGLIWDDPVHGNVIIEDPVIVAITETPAFQRLWGVQQHGDRWAVGSLLRALPHSRAEHSLGVYHVINQHAPPDPALRVAALIHDIGHPAFSHHGEAVFDFSREQEWHEQHVETVLADPSYRILPILEGAGIQAAEVLAKRSHPLLDQPRPNLNADRIDYVLRDLTAFNNANRRVCAVVLDQLRVTADQQNWYFSSPEVANYVNRALVLCNDGLYTNPMMRKLKYQTRDTLAYALQQGYLEPVEILEGTDDEVLEKLWSIKDVDPELDYLLLEWKEYGLARTTSEMIGYVMDRYEEFQEFDPSTKQRRVDPLCKGLDQAGNEVIDRASRWIDPDDERAVYDLSPELSAVLMGAPTRPLVE